MTSPAACASFPAMLAMQYSIPLPVNLDADYVRERVNQRRVLFDGHQGLLHKSFVYCPKEHIYAPFYLWKDVGEAQDFLLDDLYQGVIESFGRHRVRSWLVVSAEFGDKSLTPNFAQRELDAVPSGGSLKQFAAEEKQRQQDYMSDHKALYMRVVALDADRWEVMRFSLWADRATCPDSDSDCLQTYDVLHVSEG